MLVDAETWVEGGGVRVVRGVVRGVLGSRRAVLRARSRGERWLDLEGLVLTPGLVDAHAHLDLGALRGRVPAGRSFTAWIRSLLRARARLTPYTTSTALLAGVRALCARRALPLAIHWAETREEGDWLEHGRGPLAGLLPPSPRRPGLALLDAAGLLGPRTALVHGNHPRASELELLARRGIILVHCPGTHAFFARARAPLERYLAAGVPVALGTDSLASNQALDMRREMALLRAGHPRLDPARVFAMATLNGARALGLGGGHLRSGAPADAVAWRLSARTRRAALEELSAAQPAVERVFVAGRAPATHAR